MPVTAVRDEGALRMWVCRLPVHIGPAECTVFTGIFGEFTAAQRGDVRIAPYIQRGNCLRIRRKFSKEFTAFCRAEQSPAPTNCGCISTVFA